MLQKRYVKGYLTSYNRASSQFTFPLHQKTVTGAMEAHHRTMCLIDSDFDTEDEEFGDDIEEIIAP